MAEATLALVLHEPDDEMVARVRRIGARLTGRAVEVIAGRSGGSPGANRNRALAATEAPYVAFLVEPPRTAFLEVAARLLDGDPAAAFVTGWGGAVPVRHDPSPRPASLAGLIGRPWFSHTPTLLRRGACVAPGGFDETLAGAEEVDLLIRLVAGGGGGLVIEDPELTHGAWGTSAAPNSGEGFRAAGRALYEKHRALFDAHHAEILVAKERTVRELVDRVQAATRRGGGR